MHTDTYRLTHTHRQFSFLHNPSYPQSHTVAQAETFSLTTDWLHCFLNTGSARRLRLSRSGNPLKCLKIFLSIGKATLCLHYVQAWPRIFFPFGNTLKCSMAGQLAQRRCNMLPILGATISLCLTFPHGCQHLCHSSEECKLHQWEEVLIHW